jgi:hypothetical protein
MRGRTWSCEKIVPEDAGTGKVGGEVVEAVDARDKEAGCGNPGFGGSW